MPTNVRLARHAGADAPTHACGAEALRTGRAAAVIRCSKDA
jgi:hypothetical protein